MIKNFEDVKKQLQQLSTVINSFKSEAVQLKIIELLFRDKTIDEEEILVETKADAVGEKPHRTKTKKPVPKKKKKKAAAKKKTSKGRPGPGEMLNILINEGFFDSPKTLNDTIEHCKGNKAFNYRNVELSTSFSRAVRNQKLSRKKNKEHQYEYKKA